MFKRKTMNPKSAVDRTKNHLAYKLGKEMISSKSCRGGGDFS